MAKGVKFPIEAFDKTAGAFASVDRRLGGLAKSAKNVSLALTGIATAGAAAFGVVARDVIKTGDQFDKLSTRLGVSTEALSELAFVAERGGLSFETLSMGMQRAQRRIAEAAQGSGEAKDAIRELGLEADELVRLPLDDQLERLAEALADVENAGDRTRLAMKLFDSEGVALLQIMKDGAGGIRELRDRAEELGLTLDQAAVQELAAAKDAMTDLDAATEGLKRRLVVEFAPALSEFLTDLGANLPKWIDAVGQAFTDFQLTLLRSTEAVYDFGAGVAEFFKEFFKQIPAAQEFFAELEESMRTNAATMDTLAWSLEKGLITNFGQMVERGNEATETIQASTEATAKYNTVAEVQLDRAEEYIKNLELQVELMQLDTAEREKQVAIMEAQNRAMEEGNLLSEEQVERIRDAVDKRTELEKAQKDATETEKEADKATKELTRSQEKLANVGLNTVDTALRGNMETWQDWASLAINAITDVISTLFQSGSAMGGGGGKGGGLLDILLMSAGGLFGGGGGGGATAALAGAGGFKFSGLPGLAKGGTIPAGGAAIVGEDGPEIATAGRAAMGITPMSRGDTYVIDARGADQAAIARLEAMIMALNGSIERRAISAMANKSARRGTRREVFG